MSQPQGPLPVNHDALSGHTGRGGPAARPTEDAPQTPQSSWWPLRTVGQILPRHVATVSTRVSTHSLPHSFPQQIISTYCMLPPAWPWDHRGRKRAGHGPEGPSQLGDTASYRSQSTPRAQQGDGSGSTPQLTREPWGADTQERGSTCRAGVGVAESTLWGTSWWPPAPGALLMHCVTSGPLLQAAHCTDPSCLFVPEVTSRSPAQPGAGSRAAPHELAGQSARSSHQLRWPRAAGAALTGGSCTWV